MRKILLVLGLLLASALGSHAYAACPVPNPNLNGFPFVDNCTLPASALNAAFGQLAGFTPMAFGAVGNGTANDQVAVQAAITAGAHGTMNLGGHLYGLSSGVTCSVPEVITGTQANADGTNYGIYSGLRALVVNIPVLLTLQNGCSGGSLQNFGIDMGFPGQNTSGIAIEAGTGNLSSALNNFTISGVAVTAPCIGIQANGNTIRMDRVHINQVTGTGCGGMLIGNLTTGASTAEVQLSNSVIQACPAPNANLNCTINPASSQTADYDAKFEDCGGCFVTGSDFLFATRGTIITPGAGQFFIWFFGSNTSLGDTTVDEAVLMDTGTQSSDIQGFNCVNCWASGFLTTGGFPAINIKNTGGSSIIDGVSFTSLRVQGPNGNGITLAAGPDEGSVTGYITGTALHVTSVSGGGKVFNKYYLTGSGVATATQVVGFTSGTLGGVGVYVVNQSQTAGSSGSPITLAMTAPGVVNFGLHDSTICGAGANSGAGIGLEIGSLINNVVVNGNSILGNCNAISGNTTSPIQLDGTNYLLTIGNNNLVGWTSGQAISGDPVAPFANTGSNIRNNSGVDDQLPVITAASTIDPQTFPTVSITGSTEITTISTCLPGRVVNFVPVSSGVNFGTGGNIKNVISATEFVPVIGTCDLAGNWNLK